MEKERLNVKVCVQDLLSLLNDLGQKRVDELINEINRQQVKEFLDNLLPTGMIVGDRLYKITNLFLKEENKKM